MASFLAKIGWIRQIKRKFSFRSVPTQRVIENFKKIATKLKKLKKYHYDFISSQNRLENVEKERKYKLSFHIVHS